MSAPRTLAFLVTLAAAPAIGQLQAQQRIACLGDSITFGARIDDRVHHSYPAQLQALREDDEVRNFGVGGATLLRAGDRPYVKTRPFAQALAWRPDIAIVVLGTNDTCGGRRQNWDHEADLEADARAMCAQLVEANPDVRIVLASTPPMLLEQPGLDAARVADLRERSARLARIAAALRTVAAARDDRIEFLELGSTLRVRDVVDGVHPNAFGAERIARRVDERLRTAEHRDSEPLLELRLALGRASVPPHKVVDCFADTFLGFDGTAFDLPKSGAGCRVFAPHTIAKGVPWVLRARFFGHQPALDLALLERGFHLVYCDVANLYGSDAALDRWDELYEFLITAGFSPQATLEGMSRGGLPIVNWAARHPDKVAAIYGDNPVCDFRSWPGGKNGKRSDADWQRCLKAYGLDEDGAAAYAQMPVDRLAKIAANKVPLLLVLGQDDDVVPPAENGLVLAERYRALGGPVQVWNKPGQGHHPHGLSPVEPLLRAILRANGMPQPITTTPVPSVEYRKGAGWGDDGWHGQVEKMRALAIAHPDTKLVFLGDSITQGLTGASDRRAKEGGTRAIDRAFGQHGALSLGMSGDRTEHVLWRIQNGALTEIDPTVIVLQIGVNNVNAQGHAAAETADGVRAVLDLLAEKEPQATVLVCGPFPAGASSSLVRQAIDELHTRIAPFADGDRVRYLDLRPLFVDEDGEMNDHMRGDRVHITTAGQQAWLQALQAPVASLLSH